LSEVDWKQRWLKVPDPGALRPWLRSAFTRNMGFKALSVIFAFATWAWVQGEQVVEQKARVEIDWNIPDHLALVGEVPMSLSLTVSGSQVFVRNVRSADLRVRVDLDDAAVGIQQVQFQDRVIHNLPQNVRVVGMSPTLTEFELDEKVSKRVKLSPLTIGEPASGYRLVDVSVDPASVVLEGPAAVVMSIKELATSVVDVSDLRATTEEEIVPGRLPQGIERVDDLPLLLRVDIEPVSSSRVFDSVPVIVHSKGWNTDIETVTVVFDGPISALKKLTPEDATVVVTVDEGATLEPRVARRGQGVAHFRVLYPYEDRITVSGVQPETIPVRPLQE